MKKPHRTKLIHEGRYLAEVDVELLVTDDEWSPYLTVEDAYKLDDVREALKKGDTMTAGDTMNQANVLIKVLIADDEIPYGDERDKHTREIFRKTKPKATDEDYLKGYEGMRGAYQALHNELSFKVTPAQRFKEAENLIRDAPEPFDVAIIDLGWYAELDLEDRDNAGTRLVNAIRAAKGGRRTRIIMYSSRYDEDEVLVESACRLGALPLVKTYTKASHRTLVAAVRFLFENREASGRRVFIGHGRSPLWEELKEFLDRLGLPWDEFNREAVAGFGTPEVLKDKLSQAAFAFFVMTAEEAHADSTIHPRPNVIHEAGLFQGRLGFQKAIVLLEEGCSEFSNIAGLTHIPFKPGKIQESFKACQSVLEREGLL
ncbi:MAG: nucleotide-binding protein [Nitrospira sp.]|nr:nucleotide-binding protein [Nitrospira sp.]